MREGPKQKNDIFCRFVYRFVYRQQLYLQSIKEDYAPKRIFM